MIAMDTLGLLHDVKNELNVISLAKDMAERASQRGASDAVLHNLGKIAAACERCNALIEAAREADSAREIPVK
jgi:signal transduction histidine kinase